MPYPQIIDYNEAVQDPRTAFGDGELKVGQVAETPLGLPLALSGGFALTYTVRSGGHKFAVRCFHREVPEAQSRYAAISNRLQSLASPYFVNFQFQPTGIRVRGASYPIVKMDWVEGETLGVHLERIAANRTAIGALRQQFMDLATFLEGNTIAHGDIQNDNVIVQPQRVRLIDYDGLYVSGMPLGRGTEVGQRNFQHPGRETKHFGPHMDRFSFIVLDVSLEAIAVDPELHRKYREGGLAIIFKANDFADPSSSEVFRKLDTMPALRESARKLAAICGAAVTSVPTVADFVAGRHIPTAVTTAITTAPKAKTIYLGAFDVIAAQSYAAVFARVGDKVELVGRIVSIKEGIGKRGRGRNRPYVFVNFGAWNQESVKITIWSEGLSNLSNRPTAAWVGRWISVTGLIEPPYEGSHYGRPYRNVGITVTSDSQIVQLSEQEAQFRLGKASRPGSVGTARTPPQAPKATNAGILDQIKNPARHAEKISVPPHRPAATPSPASLTSNQRILRGIQAQPGASTPYAPILQRTQTTHTSTPVSSSREFRIPWWVWALGGASVMMYLFFH